MVAKPMTLDTALNHQGYTIDVEELAGFDIDLPEGTIRIPTMQIFGLTWHRDRDEEPIDSMFLKHLPVFDPRYRPIALSTLLGHYRSRRIGYHTPGEFANAVQRWANENLGPTSILNRRWRSTAIDLPLDNYDLTDETDFTRSEEGTYDKSDTTNYTRSEDRDGTTTDEGYDHSLATGSDFPQTLISGSGAYASDAADTRVAINRSGESSEDVGVTGNETKSMTNADTNDVESNEIKRRTGRDESIMELLEKQRASYANVDAEFREAFEPLMLQVFDRDEGVPGAHFGLAPLSGYRLNWPEW